MQRRAQADVRRRVDSRVAQRQRGAVEVGGLGVLTPREPGVRLVDQRDEIPVERLALARDAVQVGRGELEVGLRGERALEGAGRLVAALEVEGLDHLEVARADADGRGALVVGPHLGNWELGAAKLTALGIPVAAVYRGPRQPALDRALRRLRGGEGEGGIEHIAMGRRAGVQFVRALTGGRNVLALLDQHARGDEGVPVTFFGRPASTRFGPLKLAARVGAPVLIASVRRSADRRRHTLTIEPALQLEPGASDDEEILRRNLQQVTAELERTIRANPGQWIWTHRRWRENPSETSAG